MGTSKQSNVRIAPSILAADFLHLADQVMACEQAGADLIHCDVMDGHFVPNLTFGPPLIKQLGSVTKLPLDVHLMINAPERSLDWYHEAGARGITVHQEVSPHLHRTLQKIRAQGIQAGVALNPSTAANTIETVLDSLDIVLIMTVNPGFGGQRFISSTLKKIEQVAEWKRSGRGNYVIAVDGGIDMATASAVIRAGADTLVAGTSVFKGDIAANIRNLRAAAEC